MTLPPCYSGSPVGEGLTVPYEAPQGRRLNVIGGYISHGPNAGALQYRAYAGLPKSKSKTRRKTDAEIAASYGLSETEIGPIDSDRFLAFLWQLAGRPQVYASDWKRPRSLWIVLDNYSVHKGELVKGAAAQLEAANIHLFYLPSYSPQLSDIEPVWHGVKHHEMQTRSHTDIKTLKQDVEAALARKADALKARHAETTNLLCRSA